MPPYVDGSVGVAAGVAVLLDWGVVIAGSALQSKHCSFAKPSDAEVDADCHKNLSVTDKKPPAKQATIHAQDKQIMVAEGTAELNNPAWYLMLEKLSVSISEKVTERVTEKVVRSIVRKMKQRNIPTDPKEIVDLSIDNNDDSSVKNKDKDEMIIKNKEKVETIIKVKPNIKVEGVHSSEVPNHYLSEGSSCFGSQGFP